MILTAALSTSGTQYKVSSGNSNVLHTPLDMENVAAGKVVPLLCLSKHHGQHNCEYEWAFRLDEKGIWKSIPENTCLLYGRSPGEFRCMIALDSECSTSYHFQIKSPIILNESQPDVLGANGDDLEISKDDITCSKIIGRGSFAVVMTGEWNGTEVAVKIINLPPEVLVNEVAKKEINILRKLHHPNIVTMMAYYAVRVADDALYIVMEYVAGPNLDEVIFGTSYQASMSIFHNLIVQVTKAVCYMHAKKPVVVHHDLKPKNILVTTDLKKAVVCDLGVAKLQNIAATVATSHGEGPGTTPYTAPELFKPAKRTAAVDIYALGCVMIEAFGRKRVWPGLNRTDIIQKMVGSYQTPPEMPSTSHLPCDFGTICRRCCLLQPTERPVASEVLRDLQELFPPEAYIGMMSSYLHISSLVQ